MIHFPRWKIILISLVCFWGVVYAAPNFLKRSDAWPSWLPSKTIHLGLDLQGGLHLLMGVELREVVQERLDGVIDNVRTELRGKKILYRKLNIVKERIEFIVSDPKDIDRAWGIVSNLESGIQAKKSNQGKITLNFTEEALAEIKNHAVAQSIEILRRRIDETGTKEPVIQRQGQDRILIQMPGIKNPEAMKKLIGKTAKLTFHMVDEKASPSDILRGRVSPGSKLVPYSDEDDRMEAVRRRVRLSGDRLTNAQAAFSSRTGQPVVSFQFDTLGAKQFCKVTKKNVNRRFAAILDNQIITAPVINEPICGGQGEISGRFTMPEAQELALLLRAGALPAPLTFLEERTVGPSLGADSVAAGKLAGIIALAAVIVFMIINYRLFGAMAALALIINMTLIIAVLSILQATLTLPGIAGIVLTIGMAVDANVLVFERIREEVRNKRSPISSVETGYRQAMSTIVDSNLTTLIAAVILYVVGVGAIKGFAVTLMVGIITSLFSAVMVTRLFVVTWLRRVKPKSLPV